MKNLLLILIFSFFSSLNAQKNIMLQLAPRLGSQLFSLNSSFDHPDGKYKVEYSRFEYYISDIKIIHDGGQIMPIIDYWILARPAIDSIYNLGNFDVNKIEGIKFSIGVDPAHNHMDPASFLPNHPLSPQNPSMQWGWTAGYRFVAIEGQAGTNLAQHFEVHALDDSNYKTVSLQLNAEDIGSDTKKINIIADYKNAVKKITLSSGLVVHGSTGSAVTLLSNMSGIVFAPQATTAVSNIDISGKFSVYPNPSTNQIPFVEYSLPPYHNYSIIVSNEQGLIISKETINSLEGILKLNQITNVGEYLIQLWGDRKLLKVEKLVVLK